MTTRAFIRVLMLAGLTCAAAGRLSAAVHETVTLEAASEVLDGLAAVQLKGIPPALLRDAEGVAIIPDVIKASFIVGGRHGRGVMLVREEGGAWGKPKFVSFSGGGVGWQVGIQSTDLVLVFKTRRSVERILQGKGKVTLGADVAVAAGPVGRQAEANTDAKLQAEIYSYSRSRGLFAGVSLEGAALLIDQKATEAYYRNPVAVYLDRTTGQPVPVTPPEDKLRLKLTAMSTTTEPPPILQAPTIIPVPPPAPAVPSQPSVPR